MPNTENPQTEEDWLACLPLPQYIAKITAGHILSITGEEIWIDGEGQQMTRDEYTTKWPGVDPIVVWGAVKRYLAEHGGGVHVGR
jgi:hypothetical protein